MLVSTQLKYVAIELDTTNIMCVFHKRDYSPIVLEINGKFIVSKHNQYLSVTFDTKWQWASQFANAVKEKCFKINKKVFYNSYIMPFSGSTSKQSRITKGTSSFGKRCNKMHTLCHWSKKSSFYIQKKTSASCVFQELACAERLFLGISI